MSDTKDECKDRTGDSKGQQYDSNQRKQSKGRAEDFIYIEGQQYDSNPRIESRGRPEESKGQQYDSNPQKNAGRADVLSKKTSGKGDRVLGMRNAQKSTGRIDECVEDESARRTK